MAWKPPQKAKRDANEPEVFYALRCYGIHVYPTDLPTDAIAYFRGKTYLVEVKNGPKAPLTKPQEKFIADWPGDNIVILRSKDEAIKWAESLRYSNHVTPS